MKLRPGLGRQVDSHLKRGTSVLRLGLAILPMVVADARALLLAWLPVPLQELEPCIPSRREQQNQPQAWFAKLERPPRSRFMAHQTPQPAVA